ncbi:type III secretion system (T3SS) protein YscO [Mesorhizobium sp. J18]|uniref:type III secretion system stalk subunit SctO n=1 Tax=Mesorhizobium sp. J18 TaxID=935263 RepID=UPI001198E6D1|nr:YscO family type III secretion system apparatus protein [Mesorhizobium sp. J18]TWG99543.1 type III secretion system (T3SS) protein YscO [Mesorhizobium sp. J18]
MDDREMIARLRDLRSLREQRAQEKVIRQHATLQRAEKKRQEAVRATETHVQETVAAEQTEFGALLGQAVDVQDIHRLQGRFQKAAADFELLRKAEEQAAAAEQDCQGKLTKARGEHRSRMRAVAKLDVLLERLAARSLPRQALLEESRDEEAVSERASHIGNGKA